MITKPLKVVVRTKVPDYKGTKVPDTILCDTILH